MTARKWAVWSWDAKHSTWLAVGEGTEKEMRAVLEGKRAAARRLMSSAQFTTTPLSNPPKFIPEDQEDPS